MHTAERAITCPECGKPVKERCTFDERGLMVENHAFCDDDNHNGCLWGGAWPYNHRNIENNKKRELMQKDAEAASPTLAGLKGKRFVTMSESNEYGKLDEEKIKQLTGGEEISARALYQSAITYKPQFTLWLSCNDLPLVTDKSLFASERIKVIEFNRHFSPEEQDTHLKDELTSSEAMSGIFMWLVRGYIKYKENGLAMTDALKSVVNEYERENDLVLQFLESRCDRKEGVNSKAKDLYNSFKMWAKSEGAYVLSARKFNAEMERHPEWFDRKSTSSGFVIYWGLKLKEVL